MNQYHLLVLRSKQGFLPTAPQLHDKPFASTDLLKEIHHILHTNKAIRGK